MITAVHLTAVVASSGEIGRGTVVMAGAVINCDAKLGQGVIVNTGAVIEHDVVVGDYAHLSQCFPGRSLATRITFSRGPGRRDITRDQCGPRKHHWGRVRGAA